MGQSPGHGRKKPRPHSEYAGPTTCLRCDVVFQSWDRRQNRLCDACRQAVAEQPSEESSYHLTKRKGHPLDRDDG